MQVYNKEIFRKFKPSVHDAVKKLFENYTTFPFRTKSLL